jgi:hypothetical protein
MKLLFASLLAILVPLGSAAGGERFACNMKALTATELPRYQELAQALRAAAQEQKELRNGYAFRLPPGSLTAAAEWVALERKCCPFFTFELQVARDQGPVWLRITGTKGVKEFIRSEFEL